MVMLIRGDVLGLGWNDVGSCRKDYVHGLIIHVISNYNLSLLISILMKFFCDCSSNVQSMILSSCSLT